MVFDCRMFKRRPRGKGRKGSERFGILQSWTNEKKNEKSEGKKKDQEPLAGVRTYLLGGVVGFS